MQRCKENKESQTRWYKPSKASIKGIEHVITQRGELNMLKSTNKANTRNPSM